MAQHARPNVMGQRLDLRAQFTTLSTVVKTRLSPKRFWMMPPTWLIPLAPVLGPDPLEVALAPHVGQGHHEDGDEDEPLGEGQQSELAEDDRPGKEEHRL